VIEFDGKPASNMTLTRLCFLALAILVLLGCDRVDFRNGYAPGEVETIDNAKVYHLADGVFVAESKNGSTCYYLIESTVADYKLTAEGLDIVLEGEKAGTYSTTPAPQGYVAAWITEVEGDGPGVTRLQIEDATIGEFLKGINESTTVQDVYRLKR
jgi:hypothetical protein